MDSSTSVECREITAAVGGPDALAAHTGSRAFERFTGPQIRKFSSRSGPPTSRRDASIWSARVSRRCSSGARAARSWRCVWHEPDGPVALSRGGAPRSEATAPDLAARLPPIVPSWTIIGTLAPFWQARCALPAARVVAWSGDNPCSLIGTGLVREGRRRDLARHERHDFRIMPAQARKSIPVAPGIVFGAPTGDYMGMTVLQERLARARARPRRVRSDLGRFLARAARDARGQRGRIMLPWFEPEITPLVPDAGRPAVRSRSEAMRDANVRAVVEGADDGDGASLPVDGRHDRHDLRDRAAQRPTATILQVMADVFDADVYQVESRQLRGARRRACARSTPTRLADGRPLPWEEVVAGFVDASASSRVTPDPRPACDVPGAHEGLRRV